MKQTLLYRLPLMMYCIIIFVQSSFSSLETLPSFAFSDKLMHLVGYALLGALAVRAFKREFRHTPKVRVITYAIVFSTLYGASDEIHQSFVAERTADIMDVAADCLGSSLGAWIFWKDLFFD